MAFLTVLLTILKIILIIILVLLALLLVLTAVVLFVPLSYGCKVRYADVLDGKCRLNWLFGIVKLGCDIDKGEVKLKMKLPFGLEKKLSGNREEPLENTEYEDIPEDVPPDAEEEPTEIVKTTETAENTEDIETTEDTPFSEYKDIVEEQPEREEDTKKKKSAKKKKFQKSDKRKNLKDIITEKTDKIKSLWEKYKYIITTYDIKAIISLTFELLKEFIHSLGVKKCSISGVFGLPSPSYTGLALGGVGMLSAYLPWDIAFKGDFEKTTFKCSGIIEGKTNIFSMILPILKYIFKKPVFKVIKDFLLRKD